MDILELKNSECEMKVSLNELWKANRKYQKDESVSFKMAEYIPSNLRNRKKKMILKSNRLNKLWDNITRYNIQEVPG